MTDALIDKIRKHKARICVIGLGYVGLPTALIFAEKGYQVIGCDVKTSFINAINSGLSPLEDLSIGKRIKAMSKKGRLSATLDTSKAVNKSDIVIITVPTPTKEGFEPDLHHIVDAGKSIMKGLRKGQLIILESTVFPGVTEGTLKPILEQSHLTVGKDFGLAFCPERYNPGDEKHTIDRVTRILGAVSDEWSKIALELYQQITSVKAVRNIKTAEMAKIIENTQRDLNIALMNEIALICEKLGLDVVDVIQAAATKWNFNVYYPGAGVGGHCLPKDPWYLVKAAESHGYHAQIITAGRRINDHMPYHIFELLVSSLNEVGKTVKGSKIVVMGLSYKPNVGDIRNAPSLKLISEINKMNGTVISLDPYVEEDIAIEEFGAKEHHKRIKGSFNHADAIVVMTGHDCFKRIDLGAIGRKMARFPVLIDGRRIYDPTYVRRKGIKYIGIGRGQ